MVGPLPRALQTPPPSSSPSRWAGPAQDRFLFAPPSLRPSRLPYSPSGSAKPPQALNHLLCLNGRGQAHRPASRLALGLSLSAARCFTLISESYAHLTHCLPARSLTHHPVNPLTLRDTRLRLTCLLFSIKCEPNASGFRRESEEESTLSAQNVPVFTSCRPWATAARRELCTPAPNAANTLREHLRVKGNVPGALHGCKGIKIKKGRRTHRVYRICSRKVEIAFCF